MSKARYNALADVLKAIAHPTRLLIAEEVAKQPRCVSELTNMIGADTSTVSKHLSVMKNSGLVEGKKNGNQIFYSLRVPCILEFLGCIESVLEHNAKDNIQLLNTLCSCK